MRCCRGSHFGATHRLFGSRLAKCTVFFLVIFIEFLIATKILSASAQPAPLAQINWNETVENHCKVAANRESIYCKALLSNQCLPALTLKLCEDKIRDAAGGVLTRVGDWLSKNDSLVNAAGAVLVAALLTVIAWMQRKLTDLRARILDPFRPTVRESPLQVKAVNVVVVGEGGTGKTSLIRALTGCEKADPSVPSKGFRLYTCANEVDVRQGPDQIQRVLTRLYIEDYEGQKTNIRVNDEGVKRREAVVQSTVLIIMVDLFPTVARTAPKLTPQELWDQGRVDFQMSQYAEAMIDVLANMSSKLTKAILFINKFDLIRPTQGVELAEARVQNAYRPLIDRLDRAFAGMKFSVIVGSAATGLNVSGYEEDRGPSSVMEFIVRAAVPPSQT